MSWTKSSGRTSNSPDDRLSARLATLFEPTAPPGEYTFNHIFEIVNPGSAEQLSLALARLVSEGKIRQFVRVQSPTTHGGLEDFPSILDVPDELHDLHLDTWFRVRPENLVVMYRRND